jgi:RecJ-like exonuclease
MAAIKNIGYSVKKALGVYSTAFIIVSDALAYFVKKTLLIIHDFIPLVLAHKGVDFLQSTKNTIGKGLSDYTYCPRCAGNGTVFVKVKNSKKLTSQICPLCNGTGKYYMDLSKGRCDKELCLTKEASTSYAVDHVEDLIRQAKEELAKKQMVCERCDGRGYTRVEREGRTSEEICPACNGIGKDYSVLASEIITLCTRELLETGYTLDEAKNKCKSFTPGLMDKSEILLSLK